MHRNTGLHQREFEGEAASDQKRDQIVMLRPDISKVAARVHQLAMLPHTVQRDIRANITAGGDGGLGIAGIEDFKDWAGLGVALGEQQEIKRVFTRQRDHIRLGETAGDAAGRAHHAVAERLTRLLWRRIRVQYGRNTLRIVFNRRNPGHQRTHRNLPFVHTLSSAR